MKLLFSHPASPSFSKFLSNSACKQNSSLFSSSLVTALEKEMTTHSSILSWRIPWTEEPGGLQSMGVTRSWTQLVTNTCS